MKGPFAVILKRSPSGGMWKITGLYMRRPNSKRAQQSVSHCRDREDAVQILKVHTGRMEG